LLAGRKNAYLNKILVEEKDIAFTVDTYYQTMQRKSLFIVDIVLKDQKKLEQVKKSYRQAMTKYFIDGKDMELVKGIIRLDDIYSKQSVDNAAFSLGYFETISSYQYERDYLLNLSNVTVKDCSSVYNKYFNNAAEFYFYAK